jgi:hypothetical protein
MRIAPALFILVGGLPHSTLASAQIADQAKLGLDVNSFRFVSYDRGAGPAAITELHFGPIATEIVGPLPHLADLAEPCA